jgi:hypothetical protein
VPSEGYLSGTLRMEKATKNEPDSFAVSVGQPEECSINVIYSRVSRIPVLVEIRPKQRALYMKADTPV